MRITPLILLLTLFILCCNSKTEKKLQPDSVVSIHENHALLDTTNKVEIKKDEAIEAYKNPYDLDFLYLQSDNFKLSKQDLLGEWVSAVPNFFNHTTFSIEFKDNNAFIATFSNDPSIDWKTIIGNFAIENNTIHLLGIEKDTVTLEIEKNSENFINISSVLYSKLCDKKFPKFLLKNKIIVSTNYLEKYLIGKWIGFDGEFELREDYTFDTCCSGGTWSFDTENNMIYLNQTYSDAGEEPKDLIWDVSEQNLHTLYINHRYENPAAQFPHLYFRQFNDIETISPNYKPKNDKDAKFELQKFLGCYE
ncbi:MAG: hypothetical protein O9340_03760 [Cyclobacteriaceae bacterium]|jgi:hypothetical protein|nr:hypothetical protein [Cyclobacteriaceae bacterium]